eukprot:751766-Hanusia_phi.AAC.5
MESRASAAPWDNRMSRWRSDGSKGSPMTVPIELMKENLLGNVLLARKRNMSLQLITVVSRPISARTSHHPVAVTAFTDSVVQKTSSMRLSASLVDPALGVAVPLGHALGKPEGGWGDQNARGNSSKCKDPSSLPPCSPALFLPCHFSYHQLNSPIPPSSISSLRLTRERSHARRSRRHQTHGTRSSRRRWRSLRGQFLHSRSPSESKVKW